MARVVLRNLRPGTSYTFQMRSVSEDDVSEWSPRYSFPTTPNVQAPTVPNWAAVGAFVSDGTSFIANWEGINLGLEQNLDFSHYELELSGNSKTFVFTTTSVSYTLTFEENKAKWGTVAPALSARLRAVDLSGNASAWTATLTATNALPAPPTTLTSKAGVDQISLTWNASVDTDVVRYRVYTGTTSGFVPAAGNKIYEGNSLGFTYTTTTYSGQWFKVSAVDVFNQESATFGATAAATTPTSPFVSDTTAPANPVWTSATLTNNANGVGASAALVWTQALPSPNDLERFEIRYREGTGNYTSAGSYDPASTTAVVGVPKAYTAYEFSIRSLDKSGNPSSWIAITAAAVANVAPGTVAGLTSVPDRTAMRYTWTALADADLRNYEVTFSTSSTFVSGAGTSTFYTGISNYLDIAGLSPATTYYARVRAIDVAGANSAAWSATDTKQTLGQLTPGDIGAPTLDQFGNLQIKVDDSIKTYVEEYYLSTSESTQTGGTWSTTPPTRTAGTFIWMRTLVTYQDNTTSTTPAVLVTGNAGATGGAGAAGRGITSVTPYYQTVATGAAAPAKPTLNPPGGSWVTTEPAYTANTELYRTELVVYTDAAFEYTAVSKVSAYTAAATAMTTANGKNKIVFSTADATGTTGYVTGDVWFKRGAVGTANENVIIAEWQYITGGTPAWQPRTVGSDVIANLNVGKLVSGDIATALIKITNSGAIQSSDYSATLGWRLDNTGLDINVGSVRAETLIGGTLTSTTGIINIGTGATIQTNGGAIKSNTFNGTFTTGTYNNNATAGYYLDSTNGLVVATGKITASALVAGTISGTNTITMSGADAKIVGTGFELSGTGLTVTSGTIAAAALQITAAFANDTVAATTVIDGGKITTGSIRSNAQVTVDGTATWMWEIKKGGEAIFAAMKVLGNTVLGNSTTDNTSMLSSSNFSLGEIGWQFRGDGTADLRGLAADSINGKSITANTVSLLTLNSADPLGAPIVLGGSGSLVARNETTGAVVGISGTEGFFVRGPIPAGQEKGPEYITFPISGAPNIISGVLTATTLSVVGDANGNSASLFANNFMELSSTLTLRNQVAPSAAAPQATATWAYTGITPVSGDTDFVGVYGDGAAGYGGLSKTSGGLWNHRTYSAAGVASGSQSLGVDFPTSRDGMTITSRTFKSFVKIGTGYAGLVQETLTSNADTHFRYVIYYFNSTIGYTSGQVITGGTLQQGAGTWLQRYALGTDGTNVLLATYTGSGNLTVSTYPGAAAGAATATVTTNVAFYPQAIIGTSADLGAAHWAVASSVTTDEVAVFPSGTGTKSTNHSFPNGKYKLKGLTWNVSEGRFVGHTEDSATETGKVSLVRYSKITWTTETNRWAVATTRYDATNNFETSASTQTFFTMQKRAWISVTSDAGDATSQRVYFGRKASGDLLTTELFRQTATLGAGLATGTYDTAVLSGSNPGAGSNAYPSVSGEAARINSQQEEVTNLNISTTVDSTAITAVTGVFTQAMVGTKISAAGVDAGTTIFSVSSASAATLSTNATSTIANTAATVVRPLIDLRGNGFTRIKEIYSDQALFASGVLATAAADNKPAVRIGNPFAQHLRVSDDRIIAMDSNTVQGILYLNDGGVTQSTRMILNSASDASTAAGNLPALRIGNPAATHLRIDNNELIAMSSDTAQSVFNINLGGQVNIASSITAFPANIDLTPTNGALTIAGGSNIAGKLGMTGTGSAVAFRTTGVFAVIDTFNNTTANSANTVPFHAKDIHSWTGGIFMEDLVGGGTTGATIGTSGRIVRTSTMKYKKNIKEMTMETARTVLGLKSYTFNFKDTFDGADPRTYPGFIAEQGAECGAELWVGRQHQIERDEDGNITNIVRDINGEIIYFRTAEITVAHNALIKELYAKNETLEQTNVNLEARLARLEALVEGA